LTQYIEALGCNETLERIYAALDATDWTFADAHTRGGTHGIHPYPAKFIPQIPRALIAALHPQDGSAVVDPFCGSGTTLVEASLAGYPSVGIDLHPLACLISKVKITPLRSSLRVAASETLSRAQQMQVVPPAIPALDHWFERPVQLALTALFSSIDAEQDLDVRDALRVAASSIVVRVSNQESDTRYAAIRKKGDKQQVWNAFRLAAESMDDAITETWIDSDRRSGAQIINQDVLTVEPEQIVSPVSLAITSPPYPNAYEYWLYHKYRMYWLGMDPIKVRKSEIGARPHYFKRDPHTAQDFQRNMDQVLSLLARVLADGGHACFQIGSSVIRGELIDNAAIIQRAATRAGFRAVAAMRREIPMRRKAFNPHHARIRQEDLLVFRLENR
jgi:site-specific DNA-methyltransferase (cytosine-N4-specific)